jgi:hypothetical protein
LLGVDIDFDRRRVVKRPQVGDRCFISHFTIGLWGDWTTGDRAGPLGGCSPRLCQLRIDGLAPTSKYWMYRSHAEDMGLINLIACCRQKLGLRLLLLWLSVGEKLDGDPQIGQPACWGCSQNSFFLGVVGSVQNCWRLTKGCYALTAWDTYSLGPYMDWAWDTRGVLIEFPLQGVHRFESLWLSDMSNRFFAAVRT